MNKEDLDSWKTHPVTEQMFKYLDDYLMVIGKDLVTKNFGSQTAEEVARTQAQAYGMCCVITDLINIEFEDLENFYKEDKNEEVQQDGLSSD